MSELRLAYGTSTISLSSTNIRLRHYVPIPGNPSEQDYISDSAEVIFSSNNGTARASVNSINRWFELARQFNKTGIGDRVYVEFQAESTDSAYYRSELKDGQVVMNDENTNFRLANTGEMEAQVTFLRKPYWEGPETQINLVGVQGTAGTASLTVYNPSAYKSGTTISFDGASQQIRDAGSALAIFKAGDVISVVGSTSNNANWTVATGNNATAVVVTGTPTNEAAGSSITLISQPQNYAIINASEVTGDLPTPPRVEIINTYNSATRDMDVYIAQNVFSNPASLNHILEGEAATVIGGVAGTPYASSISSGGSIQSFTWGTVVATQIASWSLSTSLMNACAGNYFRILGSLYNFAYTDLWLKVKVVMNLTTMWESEWILAPNGFELFEIATAQLPPYLAGAGDIVPATLNLWAKRATVATNVLQIDFLQLSPLDGYRKLVPAGYNLGYEARLVDDMINDYLYTDSWSDAGKFSNYYTTSAPLYLYPNKLQYLYFLKNQTGGNVDIFRTSGVKVFYRPRRSTL